MLRGVLLQAVVANMHSGDGVPCLLRCILVGDRIRNLRGNGRAKRLERLHVLLCIDIADVNHPPKGLSLELHLHGAHPGGVVGLGEGGVASPTAHLTNDSLDHRAAILRSARDLLLALLVRRRRQSARHCPPDRAVTIPTAVASRDRFPNHNRGSDATYRRSPEYRCLS